MFTHIDLWDYKTKKEKGLVEYINAIIQPGFDIIKKIVWTKAPGNKKSSGPWDSGSSRDFYKTFYSSLLEAGEKVSR